MQFQLIYNENADENNGSRMVQAEGQEGRPGAVRPFLQGAFQPSSLSNWQMSSGSGARVGNMSAGMQKFRYILTLTLS